VYEVLPLVRGLVFTFLCVHLFSCLFIVAAPCGEDCGRLDERYLTAVYWVVYTLSTVGYGDVELPTKGAKVLAIFLFCLAVVINAFFLGKVTSMMAVDPSGEHREAMAKTRQLLSLFNIPADVREDVLSMQHHLLGMKFSLQSFRDCFGALPPAIQDDLSVYIGYSS